MQTSRNSCGPCTEASIFLTKTRQLETEEQAPSINNLPREKQQNRTKLFLKIHQNLCALPQRAVVLRAPSHAGSAPAGCCSPAWSGDDGPRALAASAALFASTQLQVQAPAHTLCIGGRLWCAGDAWLTKLCCILLRAE